MEHLVVHRIVEQHAATRATATAIASDGDVITYKELNVRANGIARGLLDEGFRRGGHLDITMDHGIDLAAVLLAVLKAGGSYAWRPAIGPSEAGRAVLASGFDPVEQRSRSLDLDLLLRRSVRTSPNLPVLTRPADLACVLVSTAGRQVLVPHSTITALRHEPRRESSPSQMWEGDPGSLELWAGLMSGAALHVVTTPALRDAA